MDPRIPQNCQHLHSPHLVPLNVSSLYSLKEIVFSTLAFDLFIQDLNLPQDLREAALWQRL